jgi:hypothetical protein
MEDTLTDSSSHELDGIDPDNPGNQQRQRECVPVTWESRQMVNDYAELTRMSEADVMRYCGRERRQ